MEARKEKYNSNGQTQTQFSQTTFKQQIETPPATNTSSYEKLDYNVV